MSLRQATVRKLEEAAEAQIASAGHGLSRLAGYTINLRTASRKSGDKYWFDVTPSFYENHRVDFFVYACGSADHVFVIPVSEMPRLVSGASPGGAKQVPNFTIYLDSLDLEPAGMAPVRHDLRRFHNAFHVLRAA